jgi:tripartite-type tricarboxylate transporter receptor subunit TctC
VAYEGATKAQQKEDQLMQRLIKAAVSTVALVLGSVGVVQAQHPAKDVQYVIPFGPGGESDVSARLQQTFFKDLTGQELIIQYKPGGGGAVGWSQLNDMAADGHTIMGTNLPHIILKPMAKNAGFATDEIKNFYFFHYSPDAIVVRKDSPYQTLQNLIDAAKQNPGVVTFSGTGTFTANHIANTRFDKLAGVKTTYIPFKGTGAAVTALLGDQVQAEWGYTTVAAKHKDNTRMLAVAMEKRHPMFPDVPTFRELGIDMVGGAYRGIAVPKDTPDAVTGALSEAFSKINQNPQFQQKMQDLGFALIDVQYENIGEFMRQRQVEYSDVAKELGLIK